MTLATQNPKQDAKQVLAQRQKERGIPVLETARLRLRAPRLPVVMGLPGSRLFVVTSRLARAISDFPFPARKSSTAHEEPSRLCCRDIENDLKPGESHSSVPASS